MCTCIEVQRCRFLLIEQTPLFPSSSHYLLHLDRIIRDKPYQKHYRSHNQQRFSKTPPFNEQCTSLGKHKYCMSRVFIKHYFDFFFVFSTPLPTWRNLFSTNGIFCSGRYKLGYTGTSDQWNILTSLSLFLKSGKIPTLVYIGKGLKYKPFHDFRPIPLTYRPRAQISKHGRASFYTDYNLLWYHYLSGGLKVVNEIIKIMWRKAQLNKYLTCILREKN